MKKVLLAMSGGVDSSVAALLLQKQGFAVTGATFLLWDPLGDAACEKAAAVCGTLGLPHIIIDLRESFRREVIMPFVGEYLGGRTPNPCVLCNKAVKLGSFAEYARSEGYQYIATGHYARTGRDEASGRYYLQRAVSVKKDQSYFMFRAPQDSLGMLLLPLGGYDKPQIRALAAEAGLPAAAERDSQDVCFIPNGDCAGFLEGFTGERAPLGDFLDTEGRLIGRHRGITAYTIGQRKGLGVALGAPAYVERIDAAANAVILTTDEGRLYQKRLLLGDICCGALPVLPQTLRCTVKLRSAHTPAPAEVNIVGEGAEVIFDAAQRAPAPGQSAVLYDADGRILAGGTIL